MNKPELTELIEYSDSVFSKCFDTLMKLKSAELDNGQSLLDFQPDLASCMLKIMNAYKKICSDERALVCKKSSYKESVFSEIMSNYAKEKRMLKKLISIGKALGDGFAWFFYRNSKPQLRKHLEHESNGLFSGGIGGAGEVEFIKRNQNINGFFAVYHGITSMLRIGDFSLCGIDGIVVAVGELKTQKEENRLCISAYISSKIDITLEGAAEQSGEAVNPDPMRLIKELNKQDDLLKAKDAEIQASRESKGNNLETIIKAVESGDNVAVSDDKSTLVVTGRLQGSLVSLLTQEENDTYELPEKIQSAAQEIIIEDSPYNEIRYTSISLEVWGFRRPIIWWEIGSEYIKDIIWGNLWVMTAFNMAHFYTKLEAEGFSLTRISKEGEQPEFIISKQIDDRKVNIESREMLIDLILQNLYKPSEVVDILCSMISDTKDLHKGNSVKIDLYINQ